MKSLFLLAACSLSTLFLSADARAEQGCPDGFMPNPVWTQGQQYCIPSGTPSGSGYAPPQPDEPRWVKRWGAVSYDSVAGKFGTANAMTSKRKAEKAAISHCASKGASACKIVLTYDNQCGAMAFADGNLTVAHAPTDKEAEASALEGCANKVSAEQCKIYYSDCSYAERVQ